VSRFLRPAQVVSEELIDIAIDPLIRLAAHLMMGFAGWIRQSANAVRTVVFSPFVTVPESLAQNP